MPLAWACMSYPELHGPFLQAGLDNLADMDRSLQPQHRYLCPTCLALGLRGDVRPATEREVAAMSHQSLEA